MDCQYNCYVYSSLPSNSKQLTEFNLKYKNITLVLTVDDTIKQFFKEEKYETNEKYNLSHLSLLKSNLQKSVRRNMPQVALKTAYSMANISKPDDNLFGLKELLRRFPIIQIEDTCLTKDFSRLVWLMIYVSKDGIPHKIFLNWLYHHIYFIASFGMKDLDICDERKLDLWNILQNKILNENQISALFALKIRQQYGGMKCDQEMLNTFINLWYSRFTLGAKGYILNLIEKSYCSLETILIHPSHLEPNEILLEAIDHHCSNVCEYITKNSGLVEDIEHIIWDYRSCIHFKPMLDFNFVEYNKNHIDVVSKKPKTEEIETILQLCDEHAKEKIKQLHQQV